MTMRFGRMLAAGAAVALASCGSSSGSSSGTSGTSGGGVTSGAPGFTITIQGMAFSPLELSVPPGQTVTVVNMDAVPHSVTSEATPGAYTPGAVGGVQFDTGVFTGQRTFTIPANAPNGTVIPYYCMVHRGAMATPNGTIKIDTSAQPTGSTTGGSTGGSTGSGGGTMGGGGY